MTDATFWDHILAVLVGILMPLFGALAQTRGDLPDPEFSTGDKLALYWGNSVMLGILAGITLASIALLPFAAAAALRINLR